MCVMYTFGNAPFTVHVEYLDRVDQEILRWRNTATLFLLTVGTIQELLLFLYIVRS